MLPYCRVTRCTLLWWLFPLWLAAQPRQTIVATSDTHTAAIHADGTLWCWGRNRDGEPGDGTRQDRLTPVQVGTDSTWVSVATGSGFTLAVRQDGSLWSWGQNYTGQLGTGTAGQAIPTQVPTRVGMASTWKNVSTGDHFSLGLQQDGTLWAWGENTDGQLGDGTTLQRTAPVRVAGTAHWRSVTAGGAPQPGDPAGWHAVELGL